MNILFSSHFFPPGIGGIEEVSRILALEFTRRGHEVIVITQSPGHADFPFEVRRAPPLSALVPFTRWADLVLHNNISLRTAWPLALIRRPWVIAHQTWIARADGRRAPVDNLKLWSLRHARNIAASRALAAAMPVESRVIPNPYRDEIFRVTNTGPRERDLIFVGRLVTDKGVDILLGALAILKERGIQPRASIVGDGPERETLETHAKRLGVEPEFTGAMQGGELAAMLNNHRLLVVPSRWEEPFGIVALEAIACGCVPLVARAGGLPEAVGDAGTTFEKSDARALADRLESLLSDAPALEDFRRRAPAHLERHRPAVIAGQYLAVMEESLK
ncbi:MAG: glycosyltransferase family 4 protein [Chthoniobacteraceae bacterium]|jgi:glycosyltransferase involved in cell wall biosynthesis